MLRAITGGLRFGELSRHPQLEEWMILGVVAVAGGDQLIVKTPVHRRSIIFRSLK
jgi:hypothetical protein